MLPVSYLQIQTSAETAEEISSRRVLARSHGFSETTRRAEGGCPRISQDRPQHLALAPALVAVARRAVLHRGEEVSAPLPLDVWVSAIELRARAMRAALIDLVSSGWIGSQQPSARAPATCSRATPLHSKRGAPPGHPAEAGHPDGPADKPGRRSRPGLPAGSLTLDQPKLAECQAPVRTGALLLTDSAATVSRRAAQLYRSQREDSNLALLVSFLMSASPSGEARPLTGTQESVLFRTGLGGLRPPRMGGQLCEFPPAKQIRNFSPPKRRKRISRLTVPHTVGDAAG